MICFPSFGAAREYLKGRLRTSYEVHTGYWQGVDVSERPEARMREVFSESFQVNLNGHEGLEHWRQEIKPNLPFADMHFAERISGVPSNPGEAWRIWPWGHNAEKFLEVDGDKFSHTYQERFWPKWDAATALRRGIRYPYGDLDDLIDHLAKDPLSRQAYLPIWFPEDLCCPGRKPCTLGYHFLQRARYLHITYHIRSCDFTRHWPDDCYLAVRLLLHVLDRLRDKDSRWQDTSPGLYVMHIASLHLFINDYLKLYEENSPPV